MTAPVADAHAVAPVPRPGPERPGADGPWGRSDPALARECRGALDPFTLGVASGMPRPDGATLWTRLAPSPLALGGDVYAFYAGELHEDFERPGERATMREFVGGAITSQSWAQSRIDAVVAETPNLRYGEGRFRGYARMDLARRRALVEMRGIDDPADPATGWRTLRSFEVAAGSGRLDG